MKPKLFCLLIFIPLMGLLCLNTIPAYAAKIRIVTTLTDLADFTREVGGDLVEVFESSFRAAFPLADFRPRVMTPAHGLAVRVKRETEGK